MQPRAEKGLFLCSMPATPECHVALDWPSGQQRRDNWNPTNFMQPKHDLIRVPSAATNSACSAWEHHYASRRLEWPEVVLSICRLIDEPYTSGQILHATTQAWSKMIDRRITLSEPRETISEL